MAEKLSVKIALDGGAEIERQLASIGRAGQQAFAQISQAAEQSGGFRQLKPEEVSAKLKAMGVTGVDAINSIQAAVQSAGRLEGLVRGIAAVEAGFVGLAKVAGVVGVAVAAGMVALTKQTLAFGQAINKASAEAIKLGVGFEQFDQARLMLEKAGAPAAAISSGIAKLQENLQKLDAAQVQKVADELLRLKEFGVSFVPGTGSALDELTEAAKRLGPAADIARQALEKLGIAAPPAEKFSAVVAAFNRLGIAFGPVEQRLPEIIAKLAAMPAGAERGATAITLLGEALGTSVTQFLNAGGSVDQLKSKLGLLTTEQENNANLMVEAVNRLESAWTRFGSVAFAPQITSGLNLIISALETLQAAITSFDWQTFANAGVAAINLINGAVSAFTLQGMLSWVAQAIVAWTGLGQAAANARQQFQAPGAPLPQPGGVPMASGGLLGGRGTGTSDSNLAWLSRGEYVTPARAVAQPGVLAFLEALRRSGGNLSRVLNGMGHFALGGMVPRAIPAFAAGGLNGGMSNVTIQFPGLPAIGGLRASSDVVDQLHKAAALAQVRSGGRKPSRYS